ncbi:metal-dependent transcriptional regulator [Flavobacteriaceae bacterium F89]|uniref:Transcriptional regulator MntR n=1 Tax=Cerina litoralis TaxID=2874477 RepID=A0AAE3ES60_9FLAO|nr:metal-dependent transcriptional regulator [Cerina litoralis]MCG2459184.1 metal-dependent transcriptional regulator [Cerina litoralis]
MTPAEENYLKTIYHLGKVSNQAVTTNSIAEQMDTKPSSVTDMIKKLSEKGLVHYKKYQGVSMSDQGNKIALSIVRKHRLWEVFLMEKLNFAWDEVHDVAEQLEHVQSEKLIEKLDRHLGFPRFDPHGDPIPSKSGKVLQVEKVLLSACDTGDKGIFVGVNSSSTEFLQYLDKLNLVLGDRIEILFKESFDDSLQIKAKGQKVTLSGKAAMNIYIQIDEL